MHRQVTCAASSSAPHAVITSARKACSIVTPGSVNIAYWKPFLAFFSVASLAPYVFAWVQYSRGLREPQRIPDTKNVAIVDEQAQNRQKGFMSFGNKSWRVTSAIKSRILRVNLIEVWACIYIVGHALLMREPLLGAVKQIRLILPLSTTAQKWVQERGLDARGRKWGHEFQSSSKKM